MDGNLLITLYWSPIPIVNCLYFLLLETTEILVDPLKSLFTTQGEDINTDRLTRELTNRWFKPATYRDRKINPEAHEANINRRIDNVEVVIKEFGDRIFNPRR